MQNVKILLVEDNADHQQLLLLALNRRHKHAQITVTSNREEMLAAARGDQFDCIVLDFNVPPYTAPSNIQELSAIQPDTPCVVISSSEDQHVVVESLRNGVADFIPKDQALMNGFLWDRIERAIQTADRIRQDRREMNRRLESLRLQAETDPLTGLHNRRFLKLSFRQASRGHDRRQNAAVVLLDLDHFKQINDTFGHDTGDTVLKEVASIIKREKAKTDIAVRWGGEEFVILKHSTTLTEAWIWADSLRHIIAEEVASRTSIDRVTASVGVDHLASSEVCEKSLFRADRAMYFAKDSGRNRVCTWPMVVALDMAYDLGSGPQTPHRARMLDFVDRIKSQLGTTQLEHVGAHGRAVRDLARRVGRECFNDLAVLADLELASEFHDIGKIGIPEELLASPTALSTSERRYINQHARLGAELMRGCGVSNRAADAVQAHHHRHNERKDNGASPDIASVITVCDAIVTMSSHRPYAIPLTTEQVHTELEACRGTQFHPAVIDAAHRCMEATPLAA